MQRKAKVENAVLVLLLTTKAKGIWRFAGADFSAKK